MPRRIASRPRIARPAAEPPAGLLPDSPHPWVSLRSVAYHPFLYARMVGSADANARPGDIVDVYDKSGHFFGHGLFNPRSQIVLRMLSSGGRPMEDDFWQRRIDEAIRLRRDTLCLDDATDAYRLIHAEADGLSGLVAERFADVLVFEV